MGELIANMSLIWASINGTVVTRSCTTSKRHPHLSGLRSRCESYASDGYFSGMAGALSVNTTYSEVDVKRQ